MLAAPLAPGDEMGAGGAFPGQRGGQGETLVPPGRRAMLAPWAPSRGVMVPWLVGTWWESVGLREGGGDLAPWKPVCS